ncbi:MAG: IS1 family transposase [Candidatus Bathyarchaeia archaeon]|jgi:transposase-like protein
MQQLQTLEILCPFCNDSTVVRHGLSNDGSKQRFICRSCGKNFFVSLTTSQIIQPIKQPNRHLTRKPTGQSARFKMLIPIPDDVKCPRCNGVSLQRHGKSPNGKQRYFCKTCRIKFVFGFKSNQQKMMSNRIIHMSHLAIDNCIEIPCFLCPDNDKICSTLECGKLSAWLNSPPIHGYIPKVEEYELGDTGEFEDTWRRNR